MYNINIIIYKKTGLFFKYHITYNTILIFTTCVSELFLKPFRVLKKK